MNDQPMNDQPRHPMKRKLLTLLASLPWLASCSSAITPWSIASWSTSAPFYRSYPAVVERRRVSTMSAEAQEIRYQAGPWTLSREEFYDVYIRLIKKALTLSLLPLNKGTYPLPGPHLALVTDKRVFLVSVKPDILILVPWRYQMGGISQQLGALHKEQAKFGLGYTSGSYSGGGQTQLIIELSSIFPDVSGIEVVSDQWDGVRSLAQMEADSSLPFKTELVTGMPGFRRLILRE